MDNPITQEHCPLDWFRVWGDLEDFPTSVDDYHWPRCRHDFVWSGVIPPQRCPKCGQRLSIPNRSVTCGTEGE